jgi:hypothetical protein
MWGRQEDNQTLGGIFLEEHQNREWSFIPYVYNVGKGTQGIVLQYQGGAISTEESINGGIACT